MPDISFTLTEKDFSPEALERVSSGALIDVLAVAAGESEWNDNLDWEMQTEDDAIAYVFKWFNFEKAYIEKLNTEPPRDGLKYGAWLALNEPDTFAAQLTEWEEKQKRDAMSRESLDCQKLEQEIKEVVSSSLDDIWHEWVWGDHRSWEGIESVAGKELFGDSGTLDISEKCDTVTITFSEDTAAEIAEAHDIENPTAESMKAYAVAHIESELRWHVKKKEKERKECAEQYKKQREYEQEQKKKADDERRARLLEMKA